MKHIFINTIITLLFFSSCQPQQKQETIQEVQTKTYQFNKGTIFHTLYSITYNYHKDLNQEIIDELNKFDASLSMFNKESIITRVNNNDSNVVLDDWFIKVFEEGQKISHLTEGAFDMTVAPLVNAWGFGFKKRENVNQTLIDSLKEFVGYQKIQMVNHKIKKDDPRITLDASAIAKGFSCDIIAQLLEKKGIKNFMVEIGGEIVTKGFNPKGKLWSIGISKPVEDSIPSNELAAILSLDNIALATSGNYRNFYVKDGKKYAHTINPHTGYPAKHSLLSATVLAENCMTADALATSFMVMGLEKSMKFLKNNPNIHAYFIYSDEDGNNQIAYSEGMNKYIKEIIN